MTIKAQTEPKIEVVFDDIFTQDVDAIVNPANSFMLHGGGLAAAIAHRAGRGMVRESRANVPVPTGLAIQTSAGDLPFKGIIHVVGPVWEGEDDAPYWRRNSSDEDPDVLLSQAHLSAIEQVARHGYTSVAFPAVSCGVFRFPAGRAAPIAIAATRLALNKYPEVTRVVFCLLDDSHYTAFSNALEERDGEASPRAT